MAITKIFQNDKYSRNYSYRVAETVADVKALKTGLDELGSEVYIIEKGQTYISNGRGMWYPKDTAEGTCDCIEESTVWEELPEDNGAN